MIELTIEQKGFTPDHKFCPVCGDETKGNTCSQTCNGKLRGVRNAITNQIETDRARNLKNRKRDRKEWTEKTIRQFNQLTEILEGE